MLLSDAQHKASALYGAWGRKDGQNMGIIRSTFLIDGSGKIKKAWYNVKVAGHVDEVVKTL
jgi:peroxiredoxin Q/BCP